MENDRMSPPPAAAPAPSQTLQEKVKRWFDLRRKTPGRPAPGAGSEPAEEPARNTQED